jgi:hypothetical protein
MSLMNWIFSPYESPAGPDIPLGSGALQQSPAYAQAARACGARVDVAHLASGGHILARVQVMRRGVASVALRGPLWLPEVDARSRHHAMRRLARSRSALISVCEDAIGGLGVIPLMTPRHVALWDLTRDASDLRAALGGKWRNALVAAERRGLRVGLGNSRALTDLIEAESRQREARAYVALPTKFTRALPAASLRLWQWRSGGRVRASMCFVRHGDWATYHLGHADLVAREAGAHRAMLWQAALALQAEGVRCLDLGDINTEDTPGLARFKLGTGARLHRLGAASWVLPG